MSHLLSPLCCETFRWPPTALTRPPQSGYGHLSCRVSSLSASSPCSRNWSFSQFFKRSVFFSHLWMPLLPPGSAFPFNLLLCDKSHLLQGAPPHVLKLPVSMCITLWWNSLCGGLSFLFVYEFCENWDHCFLCSLLYTWSQCNLKEWINFIYSFIYSKCLLYIKICVNYWGHNNEKTLCFAFKVLIFSWGIHSSRWGCAVVCDGRTVLRKAGPSLRGRPKPTWDVEGSCKEHSLWSQLVLT